MIIFEQKKLGTIVTLLLVFLSIIQFVYYHSILPDRIASHFNLMGQPDNWSGKNTVMLFHLGLIFFFAVLSHFLSWITFKIPESLMNLPNKNYWLAPGRKKQTLKSLSIFFIWIGNVAIIFFMVIFNLAYQVNVSPNDKSYNFWIALILFIIAIGYMIYYLFKRFRKIPQKY